MAEDAGALKGALDAAGPVGGVGGGDDFVACALLVDGVTEVAAGALVSGSEIAASCVAPVLCFATGGELLATFLAAAPGPRLPPLPPPIPRSRCNILAAALAFPRSRFLSARAALAVLFGVTAVTVLVGVLEGCPVVSLLLLVFAACLFSTLTASRAASSTCTA